MVNYVRAKQNIKTPSKETNIYDYEIYSSININAHLY